MAQKRKHNVLSIEQKLEIINKLENGETGTSLAQFYNVGKATISGIKSKKQSILQFTAKLDIEDGPKKRKTMRQANDTSLEDAVYLWFVQRRNLGEPISGPLLCEKALELNNKLGGPSNFKASTGWLKNFKSRHGIRELHIQGDALSHDTLATRSFKQKFLELLERDGYSKDDMYNADETGINWKSLPGKSLAFQYESAAPDLEISNDRITVMICANASGTHTLPLLIVGNCKKPRCFNNIDCFPVIYKEQKNSCMDSELFYDWYKNEFISSIKKEQECKRKTSKVLLLLDSAPSHSSAERLNCVDENFKVMFLPPNVTALQPMDQGIIEKFKMAYKKQVLCRLLLSQGNEESIISFSKKLKLIDCFYMLTEAWNSLTEQNLKNAWKKILGISEKNEGENSQTYEDEVNEIVEMFKSIPEFSECDKNDAHEWIERDTGYQILSEDDIVTVVKEHNMEDNEHDINEDNEGIDDEATPTHSEATAALETVMSWYKKQPECWPTHLLLLKQLRDLAAKKHGSALKQQNIKYYFL